MTPVSCVGQEAKKCESMDLCSIYPFWSGLTKEINRYIDSYTLRDLAELQSKTLKTCAEIEQMRQEKNNVG